MLDGVGRRIVALAILYIGVSDTGIAAPVAVDTRVELAAVVARLADFEEFNAAGLAEYDAEVESYFGPFRQHPAIDLLRQLRRDRGIGYGDTVALALLGRPGSWEPRVSLQQWLSDSSTNWDEASATAMLEAMSWFERETHASRFFATHSELYAQVAMQMEHDLREPLDEGWFAGVAEGAGPVRMRIIAGLLHGPGNYGPRLVLPKGTVEAYAVIGTPEISSGQPLKWPGPSISRLLVHEFSHSFVNPWVDSHADALQVAATALFATEEARMRQNAYGDWKTLLYESLTRAVSQRYFLDHGMDAQAQAAALDDARRGFAWTAALAGLLPGTSPSRPLLTADLVPELNSLLLAWARKMSEVQAAAPSASMTPGAGDTNVDPALDRLSIRFDRPMGSDLGVFGEQMPEFLGPPVWSDDGTEVRLMVKLLPGTEYRLQLNHARMPGGFKSRDGAQLAPVSWVFRTRE